MDFAVFAVPVALVMQLITAAGFGSVSYELWLWVSTDNSHVRTLAKLKTRGIWPDDSDEFNNDKDDFIKTCCECENINTKPIF